ncbi:DUF4260 domain-containing protein [Spongiivirga sp. MCCC 1A20706]|uniref:DUF4260 domain-containing protein n=1 Tax=Spongiivirga sp. MCCC 1A20706 TaxID=3160963 RepID=UPI003977BF10
MKSIVKIEELAMFLLGVFMFNQLDFAWWHFVVFFLLPDIGMLGYAVNPKFGALCYNIFHHKGIALVIYFIGAYSSNQWILFAGIILFSHSCFDRILGYGLKYSDSFNNTHLGKIGKSSR